MTLVRVFILASVMLLIGCSDPLRKTSRDYKPLEFDGDGYAVDYDRMNREHYDRAELVLAHYNIEFERTGDTSIYLTKGLLPEEFHNISGKAHDTEWLAQRKINVLD